MNCIVLRKGKVRLGAALALGANNSFARLCRSVAKKWQLSSPSAVSVFLLENCSQRNLYVSIFPALGIIHFNSYIHRFLQIQ